MSAKYILQRQHENILFFVTDKIVNNWVSYTLQKSKALEFKSKKEIKTFVKKAIPDKEGQKFLFENVQIVKL